MPRLIMKLFALMCIVVCSVNAYGQCNYNEGASPDFNVTGNTATPGYTTVVLAADADGVIRYISDAATTRLKNLAAGKYDVYSFNFRGSAPAALVTGGTVSGLSTAEECTAISLPIRIGVCKCTDLLSTTGSVTIDITHNGQNKTAGYSTQYLALGPDGRIQQISSLPRFQFTSVDNYSIYSINYRTSEAVAGLSVGNVLSSLSGNCFDISNPLDLNVCPTGALPVTLTEFRAIAREGVTELNWTTSEETGSDYFDIERSQNGSDWNKIGSVLSHKESNQLRAYVFADGKPFSGENLYRLKMVDRDGSFAFSRIQSVSFGYDQTDISVYPNPSSGRVYIRDYTRVKEVKITDLNGRLIYRLKTFAADNGLIDVKDFSQGEYIVQVLRKDGTMYSQKIVFNK